MDVYFENLIQQRLKIVEEIKNLQVDQKQSLRQIQVPESVYKLATGFIKQTPNAITVHNKWLHIRYEILYSLGSSEGGIYDLLSRDAGDTNVTGAQKKIDDWIDATKNLLRYALNLLLAPRRPEFQNIKVNSVV